MRTIKAKTLTFKATEDFVSRIKQGAELCDTSVSRYMSVILDKGSTEITNNPQLRLDLRQRFAV